MIKKMVFVDVCPICKETTLDWEIKQDILNVDVCNFCIHEQGRMELPDSKVIPTNFLKGV